MLNFKKSIWLCISILLWSASADATTWHVEKDGTGDFTVIQHAVDAASDGDTIMIGPGRFDDFEPYDSGFWVDDIVVVIENINDLTIIGSGMEYTVIGADSYYAPVSENPQVIMGTQSFNIRIEGLKVENCEFGIVWNSGSLSLGDCDISGCYWGLDSFSPDGTHVENSEFHSIGGWSIVTAGDCRNVTVENSSFYGIGTGIGFNTTQDAFVNSCSFNGLYTAIGYSGGSSGQVTGCTMSNVENPLFISGGSQVHLLDNYLESTVFASLFVESGSYVSGNGNIFSGGGETFGTLLFSGGSNADLTGNHILRGSGNAVTLVNYYYEQHTLYLSENYWGTTDIETIEEWIYDGNDDSSIHGTVTFLPLADGPVPTDQTTLDGLKAMYR